MWCRANMKAILLLLLIALVCLLSSAVRLDIPGFDQTNEGNEFFVGFFRNRFGRVSEREMIDPVCWITTKETRRVRVDVFEIRQRLARVFVNPGQVTYVNIPIGNVVFDSTAESAEDTQFKGIRIKAQGNRRIVVFCQNEEMASNDGYLALPIISLSAGRSHEYIAASIRGDSGSAQEAKDSVALIIGTEDNTEIILEPSSFISHPYANLSNGMFIPGLPVNFRTVIIQRFQTFYLQVRGGDISGTRIIANKPISVFSGHECANVPLASEPCDILIEQLQPIDTWGTEVVSVPLRTRSGDLLKVFASEDSTTVNVAYTDISSGTVTTDSFTLSRNGFRELGNSALTTGAISGFALIQSNNPIAVFQFSRSFTTDNNIISDPFMLSVPSCEQYRDCYAVAPAPFNPATIGNVDARVAYVNYTNIAVPAEYFNASLITINNSPANASEFRPIRRADDSIWGYGAQLLLDEGAQEIRHQDPDAALSVTIYGFSNQQSWGCTGGIGLGPAAIPRIQCGDATVIENAGSAIIPCERSGPLGSSVSFTITTRDGTATAGSDYTTVTQEYTFGAGQPTVNVSIPIINDAVPENEENFFVTIMPDTASYIIVDDEAMVTVIDDDNIEVEFSAPLYSTNESTGVLQATLISSLPLGTDYQIRVRFRPGTASRNQDFDASAQRILIPAGQTRVNFTVPIVIDSVFEGTETFNMRLDVPPGFDDLRVAIGAQGTADGEIIDTDPIIVMFSQTMYSVNEGAGPAQPALVLSRASSTDITVEVTNTNGSAFGGGVDYGSGPYTVTFPAGMTSVPFDIPITDDIVYEGNENFMLTIDPSSLPGGGTVVVGSPNQATVTIVDNDPITVMFTETVYSVIENNGPAQPVLVLSNPSATSFDVTVTNTDGSATGGGVDYNSGPYTVTFPPGMTRVPFDIPINNDDIYEINENFTLTIDPSLPTGVSVGTPDEATVTIVDDDPITVMFSETIYNVNEGAGPAQPVLVLSNPSSTSFDVTVTSSDGSATGGEDYGSGPYTVTFPAGMTSVPFDIPITDDVIQEGNENFTLTIDPSLPSGISVGTPDEATVTIVDDDGIMVMFNQTMYSVTEGAGPAQPVLVLSGPSSMTITVIVTSTDGSATGGGVDYGSGPYTVTFPAGMTSVPFDIPITDDRILEGLEDFLLTIDPSSLPDDGTVVVGSPGQAAVTIVDDDPITVMFSETMYSVTEGAGPAQPVLVLSGPSARSFNVSVTNTDGSATGGGVDYGSGPYTVTFPAEVTSVPFDIPITDDRILEANETFMLTIDSSSLPPSGVSVGTPGQATVTIVDDDPITVTFGQPVYNVNESAGLAQPVLVLSGPSSMTITVTVTNTDGSATGGGVDYGSGPYTVTFPAGMTSVPFDIPITDDSIQEGIENFTLTIDPSLPSGVSVGDPGEAIVNILDISVIMVMFNQTAYSVTEGAGPAQPVLVLSGPSSMTITVTVTNTDGSASGGGVDYGSGPYTVTFPAGVTSVPFDISITDDRILEGNENFMLTIDSSSLPDDGTVVVGNPGQSTVTIVDDDPITVTFSNRTYGVDEDGGPAQPVLVLSNPSSTDITVQVRDASDTATSGDDYGPGIYSVVIPAGMTMVPFDISIVDDSILEGDEDFDIVIVPGTLPDGVTRGDPGRATVTIADNDPITINFERPTYSVNEDDGPAQPVLILSNPSATSFTVRVRDRGNTATGGGVDYGSGPYVITIPAGATRVPFDVPIINDMILENDEDFDLTIVPGSLPTGVTRGTTGTTRVTIADNDDVTVRFANRTGTVSESDGFVNLTVVKEGDADIPVTVTVTTSDGTAIAGDDYQSTTTTVTIPAGQTSVDVPVSIIDDNCREGDETFNGELTVTPGQPSVILGTPDQTTITIVDDDESTVQFINAPYSVFEGRGTYNVCLSITPACDDLRADVILVSRPKDAVPGEDYDVVTRTVTFQPNQMIRCIEMNNIIDDIVLEGPECFSLVITVPPGSRLIPGNNANVTILDDEPVVTTSGIFNDTIIGDPLYEVPLNMIPNGTFPEVTSLCYEIHGEAGQVFNLISDGCVQVNANYSAMNNPENGNIISQVGVLAYDTAGSCIEIMVDVSDCVPVVNGVRYDTTVYNMNGVTARRRNNRARIAVPNCDNRLFDNLVFWVVCQDIGGQQMIKFQVVRGSGLIPDSHGLLGQFWNIPVSASDFTGDSLTNDSSVTPYVVRVDHPDDPPRQFVAELFQRTWDKTMKPCLYAGDGQGGRIFDQVTPNDPVIAGTFRDYIVSSIFASNFVYNKLERRNCAEVLPN